MQCSGHARERVGGVHIYIYFLRHMFAWLTFEKYIDIVISEKKIWKNRKTKVWTRANIFAVFFSLLRSWISSTRLSSIRKGRESHRFRIGRCGVIIIIVLSHTYHKSESKSCMRVRRFHTPKNKTNIARKHTRRFFQPTYYDVISVIDITNCFPSSLRFRDKKYENTCAYSIPLRASWVINTIHICVCVCQFLQQRFLF